MQYIQQYFDSVESGNADVDRIQEGDNGILCFPSLSPDLALEDSVLENVKLAWKKITGQDESFMIFDERDQGDTDDVDEI